MNSLTDTIVLGLVVASFIAFAITLMAVSAYVALGDRPSARPERKITPAKRAEGAIVAH
jgi:hypothetical protein